MEKIERENVFLLEEPGQRRKLLEDPGLLLLFPFTVAKAAAVQRSLQPRRHL